MTWYLSTPFLTENELECTIKQYLSINLVGLETSIPEALSGIIHSSIHLFDKFIPKA